MENMKNDTTDWFLKTSPAENPVSSPYRSSVNTAGTTSTV